MTVTQVQFADVFDSRVSYAPKAIIAMQLEEFVRQRGFELEVDEDGLGEFKTVPLALDLGRGSSLKFALWRHEGNPAATFSVNLGLTDLDQPGLLSIVLRELEIPEQAVIWRALDGGTDGGGKPITDVTTANELHAATVPTTGMVTDGSKLELFEERLSVGTRVVNRGGTRINRYVVAIPVEENITLHEERVTLERRLVTDGRPVINADFSDKTIEMTENAEEVVVAKEAFVTEEIALEKTATDRVETIRDTVRKAHVEVVQIPGESVAAANSHPWRKRTSNQT